MAMRGLAFDLPADLVEKFLRVRFVVMDVDGTIRSADDSTAEAVSQMLGRLDKASIGWSFATGRTIAGLHGAATSILGHPRQRAMLPSICYNGGVLFVPGLPSILNIRHMDRSDVLTALSTARDQGLRALIYTCRNELGAPAEVVYGTVRPSDGLVEVNGMPIVEIDDWCRLELDNVVSVLLVADVVPDLDSLARVRRALGPSVAVTSSGGPFFEISSQKTSKGQALARLVSETRVLSKRHSSWHRFLGLTESNIMAIGDNFNDIEMLQVAGLGVAVGNAPVAVKAEADFVSSLPAGNGTVETLRLLLNVKKYCGHMASLSPDEA